MYLKKLSCKTFSRCYKILSDFDFSKQYMWYMQYCGTLGKIAWVPSILSIIIVINNYHPYYK